MGKDLDVEVDAFNVKFKNVYRIEKGDQFLYKNFWFAYNRNNEECAMFLTDAGGIAETYFSLGTFNFINFIKEIPRTS
ncbi:hypothetical protein TUM19329_26210 [Legionella antarctica]|uniref:Uncharacterized protein n=1 Tax=Legionella antarctica TaxID=2708020 RepID=A0A6F8T7Z2_9GAMM|nr:hypothetical protein [Legionella antarctica]BCA96260.1 hypothetical protein TUM19329_26210 [Legionella antarctica]